MHLHHLPLAALLLGAQASPTRRPRQSPSGNGTCTQTQVAILGAGVSGIAAAQALANASISDFVIVERNDYIGGRVAHTTFGKKPDGTPYTVELGANWVQGLGSEGGPENPIWTLTKKHGLDNSYADYESIQLFDKDGPADYTEVSDAFDEAWEVAAADAGAMLVDNLQDINGRAGLSLAGWKPKKDMHAQAVEWWNWDWATAFPPEESSFIFGVTGENLTFNQFSDEENFVWDQRGFSTFVSGEAAEFLEDSDDPRLRLSTIVTAIDYSDDDTVTVQLDNGDCIEAEHVVCTFSVGVLQNDVVDFTPPLPRWKREAIELFQMGTYTKIFMQFNETFWDADTQYFLYADPEHRGYYPIFQSLSHDDFFPDSHILFVTVVGHDSYRVEQQTDEETQAEVVEVLRTMFPDVDVPEPTAFMYPRWSQEEWAFGSFSNWPPGMTLEKHQNLRANVGRLWFAGEANSAQYFGFLHGAWFEGREVGIRIAGLLGKDADAGGSNFGKDWGEMKRYEVLHGTTFVDEYEAENGWPVSSFITWGDE